MAVGDVYRIILDYTYLGQQCNNVWHYGQIAGSVTPSAVQLLNGFETAVLTPLADTLNDGAVFNRILTVRINNPTDFSESLLPSPSGGQVVVAAADRSPSYLCATYRSNRFGPASRYSYKRFAGLWDAVMDGNQLTAAYLALAAPLVIALGSNIVSGGNSYEPLQLRGGIQLGDQVLPADVHGVTNTWVDPKLGTQNSRKP